MTRDEKKVIIDSLTEKLKENPFFYVTDAGGFSVAQINAFRRTCYEKGVEYKVYKNTLIQKALENSMENNVFLMEKLKLMPLQIIN